MEKVLTKLDAFHKMKVGYLTYGLVELVLATILGSLAINSGAWWEWLLTLVFFMGGCQNFGRLIFEILGGKKHAKF